MKPINYLSSEEKFIYRSIKEDIKNSNNINDLKLLESKLDVLLERSIKRFRVQNGIKIGDAKKQYEYSEDEILEKAITLIKKGFSDEEVQKKVNLTNDDM